MIKWGADIHILCLDTENLAVINCIGVITVQIFNICSDLEFDEERTMSRSERLRQQKLCTPLQRASEACITGTDYQGFSVQFINNYIGSILFN